MSSELDYEESIDEGVESHCEVTLKRTKIAYKRVKEAAHFGFLVRVSARIALECGYDEQFFIRYDFINIDEFEQSKEVYFLQKGIKTIHQMLHYLMLVVRASTFDEFRINNQETKTNEFMSLKSIAEINIINNISHW